MSGRRVNENCTVMTRALVNLQSLAEDLQLAGVEGQMDGKLRSSGKGGTDGKEMRVHVCICVCGSAHKCG